MNTAPNDQRAKSIDMHLEGKTLRWQQTIIKTGKKLELDWVEYINCLVIIFILHEDPMPKLKNLNQTLYLSLVPNL